MSDPSSVDDALDAALAEVGRLIEATPRDRRHARVDTFLGDLDPTTARNLIVGVFVHAHERRLLAGRAGRTVEDVEWRVTSPRTLPLTFRESEHPDARKKATDAAAHLARLRPDLTAPPMVSHRTVACGPWTDLPPDDLPWMQHWNHVHGGQLVPPNHTHWPPPPWAGMERTDRDPGDQEQR